LIFPTGKVPYSALDYSILLLQHAPNNNSAMLAMMPATVGGGCQHNTAKDASAALARQLKAKLPWCDAKYGN
jgi:hypothetical protein